MEKLAQIGLLFTFIFAVSVISKAVRIPYILSLLLAGIIGKMIFHSEIMEQIKILEIVALVLLFFFIGLDFSFERLLNTTQKSLLPGIIDFVFNFLIVFLISYLLTKDISFSIFISSALYPTGTAITVKLIENYKRTPYTETDIVLGILIIEDLICIILVSLIAPTIAGEKIELKKITIGIITIVLLMTLFFVFRKPVEKIFVKLPTIVNEEVLAFLVLGLVLAPSEILRKFNISEILLAFFLGCIVPEKSEIYTSMQRNLYGLKEFSAGLFFFLFTFGTDLHLNLNNITIIIILSVVSIISKIISIYIGTFLTTKSKATSSRTALSMIQRGEFSLVIGGINPVVKPIISIIVIITSFIGVVLFAYAPQITNYITRSSKKQIKRKENLYRK